MNSMNRITVVGRLTKDPELKELENGSKVANVTLAVDREYKDKDGKKPTDFLPFALWGKNAENICEISKKGSLICLEGYSTMREIEKDGKKDYVFTPVITNYKHLALKKDYSNDNIPEIEQEEMEK